MARSGSSTSDKLSSAAASVTNLPLTASVWMRNNALTTQQFLFVLAAAIGTAHNYVSIQTTASGQAQMTLAGTSTANQATATLAVSDALWHNYTAVITSSSAYAMFLDGANKGTQTVTQTPNNFAAMIGFQSVSNTLPVLSGGELAHIAIWNTNLSDTNVANLMTLTPPNVVGGNLVGYWTLCDNASPETDLGSGGNNLTVAGTSYVVDDPYSPILIAQRMLNANLMALNGGIA